MAEVLPAEWGVQGPQRNPVDVGLETSTDVQKSWQPAALGRYDATDEKRYFRLKSDKLG